MYSSNAKWSKIGPSKDTHDTKSQAEAVCETLLADYSDGAGCPIRGHCTAAWVESEPEEVDGGCPFQSDLPCAAWEDCFNPCRMILARSTK